MDIRAARSAYYGNKTVSRGRLSQFEVRDAGDGQVTFCGYASTTGDSYQVFDWLGEYDETIARGAFGKSLQEQDDTRLLVNHDGVPIARTKSGTLGLREITDPLTDPQGRGQTGLWCEAPNLDMANPTVQEICSAMSRGDMSEMSFSFMATRQEWNADYTQRTVLELRTFDVSLVTYPANPLTSASLTDGRSDAEREMVLAQLSSGRPLSKDQREFIREAIQERDALITIQITDDDDDEQPDEDVEDDQADVLVTTRALALASARLESARASV